MRVSAFPSFAWAWVMTISRAPFASGHLVGTVNRRARFRCRLNRADVTSLGGSLDNDVNLVTGNIYYSLPMVGPIRPYFGGGAGAAFIAN